MAASKKLMIITIIILAVASSFILFIPKMTGFFAKSSNNLDNVKLATFAVCEHEEERSYCKDKLFASCNGTLIEINDTYFNCNGERYEVGNISLGETYLNNITDTREDGYINGWATSE